MVIRNSNGRLWEIDFLRGIAIILMVFFHFLYDLNHYSVTNYRLYSGYFSYLSYGTASIFVFLVGVSLTISYNKSNQKNSSSVLSMKYVKRGAKIIGLGMIITLFTLWYIPEGFVLFGILHCIGVSIILSIPFLRYRLFNIITGSIIIFIGGYLNLFRFDFPWLLPFGFVPKQFFTIDYFPLIPWFGVVLIGIAMGNYIYKGGKRRYGLNDYSDHFGIGHICYLGRNSLYVYFFHQPILVGLIFLLFL
ncbi:hypothetical protein B6U98_00155 [Thermoplasmatales archaeon ex4572_165]|nr:MAG: hypothetical protein B6U98_00155 [Thermoplasmatales archaeon ex4572_165]RLF58639.1 MAG: DUF1624 domain-containing protein [Thermoplasmata archaeon]